MNGLAAPVPRGVPGGAEISALPSPICTRRSGMMTRSPPSAGPAVRSRCPGELRVSRTWEAYGGDSRAAGSRCRSRCRSPAHRREPGSGGHPSSAPASAAADGWVARPRILSAHRDAVHWLGPRIRLFLLASLLAVPPGEHPAVPRAGDVPRLDPPCQRRRRRLASVTTCGRSFLTVAGMEAAIEVSPPPQAGPVRRASPPAMRLISGEKQGAA